MGKHKEYERALESFKATPLAAILTDESMMDNYREYIEDEYSHCFESDDDDEKYLVEDKLDNFDEMLGDKGQAIIEDLFSDVYYGQVFEIIQRSKQLASRLAESDNILELAAWENEFGEYYAFIDRYYKRLSRLCNPPKLKKKSKNKR